MPRDDHAKPRQGDLAINADLAYQRRVWIAQRVGWAVGAVILTAAAFGLFGFGPLSWSTAGTPGAFSIEYDRFSRVTAPTRLVVRFDRAALSANRLNLFLGEDYLASLKIDSSLPRIAESAAVPGGVVLIFDAMPNNTPSGDTPPGADALEIVLAVSFTRIGRIRADIGPLHGPRLQFPHWVYP